MKLSRAQALELVKATHHVCEDRYDGSVNQALRDVVEALEEFLCSDPAELLEEITPSDCYPEEDVDGYDDEEDDEETDEVDDDSADIVADGEVKADTLHKLTLQRAVATSTSLLEEIDDLEVDTVELSFEATRDDDGVVECVDLLVCEGQCIVSDIDFVRRSGTEIQVHERGIGWHNFSINKFNKDWTKAIPVNKTLEVVE